MELSVEITEGQGADLLAWLTSDPAVARTAKMSLAPSSGQGEMGISFDILNFLVTNSIALGSLVTAIASFRDSCKRSKGEAPPVSIAHQNIVVQVENDGQDALRRLMEGLDEGEATSV